MRNWPTTSSEAFGRREDDDVDEVRGSAIASCVGWRGQEARLQAQGLYKNGRWN